MIVNTERTIRCVIKRCISGVVAALSSVSAALVVLPKDVTWHELPLGVIVASMVAFFAGIYTPARKAPNRSDDIIMPVDK